MRTVTSHFSFCCAHRSVRMLTMIGLLIASLVTGTMAVHHEMKAVVLVYEDASSDMFQSLDQITPEGRKCYSAFFNAAMQIHTKSRERYSKDFTVQDWIALSTMIVRQSKLYVVCRTKMMASSIAPSRKVANFLRYTDHLLLKYS